MAKTWLIIKHEYLTNVRRRSFLFAAFGVPIITILLMTLVFGLTINNETDTTRLGTVGYVDQSGVLAQQIDKPDYFEVYESEDAARAALDAGTIGAYFVVDPNYLNNGTVNAYSKSGIPEALKSEISTYLLANLSTGLDPTIAERIKDPVVVSIKTLNNGRVIEGNAVAGLILMPIIFVLVFLFASQTTSGFLMSGIIEEKTNHIMELLITSVTPFQMLFGKLVGLGLLGLTQLVVWLGGSYVTLSVGHQLDALKGITIPADLLVVVVIYFLLGYFLLAAVMSTIGVIIGSEQESRQYAAILSLGMLIPLFLLSSFISDPNGAVVTFLSLFPLTSPIAVIFRVSLGAIPTWQLIASIVILALTALFMAWASARIFRWGLLMYGKRPSVRELLRVIRRPPTMATSATGEQAS